MRNWPCGTHNLLFMYSRPSLTSKGFFGFLKIVRNSGSCAYSFPNNPVSSGPGAVTKWRWSGRFSRVLSLVNFYYNLLFLVYL